MTFDDMFFIMLAFFMFMIVIGAVIGAQAGGAVKRQIDAARAREREEMKRELIRELRQKRDD